MKIGFAAALIVSALSVCAGEIRYRIYAIDPRGVSFSQKFLPTFYSNQTADIIAVRDLTNAESARLKEMLNRELSKSTDVPFCGHMPGYAVEIREGQSAGGMVTLCGTCGTWAGKSGLFVLSGKEALTYLDQLLPLPEVFRKLPPGKIFTMDKSKPFYEVKSENEN